MRNLSSHFVLNGCSSLSTSGWRITKNDSVRLPLHTRTTFELTRHIDTLSRLNPATVRMDAVELEGHKHSSVSQEKLYQPWAQLS